MNVGRLIRNGLIVSVVAVVAAMLGSCVVDPEQGWVELPEGHSEHTLVMYMFADNNLRGDMIKNIVSAEKGLAIRWMLHKKQKNATKPKTYLLTKSAFCALTQKRNVV